MNAYLGNKLQLCGVQEMKLVGGKGEGLRLYEVTNGKGLELKISPDRSGDITQVKFQGINCSYLSPCGYVSPVYYEATGANWLKSFTAGFLTTCGLQSAGAPCVDEGEELPLHGSVSNLPSIHSYWEEDDREIRAHAVTEDELIFGRKLVLHRVITVSKEENTFTICDEIENTGAAVEPFQLLYHMNMGYPLLDEDSVVTIPSVKVEPKDEIAAAGLENWMKMEKPQAGFAEQCFYHTFEGKSTTVSIRQPKNGVELSITADPRDLDQFVEWKMMGVREYVLGLEFGNTRLEGRNVMRENGILKYLKPGEKKQYTVRVDLKKRV